jgi:hypothetical protein
LLLPSPVCSHLLTLRIIILTPVLELSPVPLCLSLPALPLPLSPLSVSSGLSQGTFCTHSQSEYGEGHLPSRIVLTPSLTGAMNQQPQHLSLLVIPPLSASLCRHRLLHISLPKLIPKEAQRDSRRMPQRVCIKMRCDWREVIELQESRQSKPQLKEQTKVSRGRGRGRGEEEAPDTPQSAL